MAHRQGTRSSVFTFAVLGNTRPFLLPDGFNEDGEDRIFVGGGTIQHIEAMSIAGPLVFDVLHFVEPNGGPMRESAIRYSAVGTSILPMKENAAGVATTDVGSATMAVDTAFGPHCLVASLATPDTGQQRFEGPWECPNGMVLEVLNFGAATNWSLNVVFTPHQSGAQRFGNWQRSQRPNRVVFQIT